MARLIDNAKKNVALYERLYATTATTHPPSLADALASLPVIDKHTLLETPIRERVDRRLDLGNLASESTTGSTGQPFTLYLDNAYVRKRNLRFFRALLGTGLRPWHRFMLLTDRYTSATRAPLNRLYVPVEQPTAAIVRAYETFKPDVLYGFLTPLKLLADELAASRHRPKLVISTAEMLDAAARDQLESAFSCPVTDFYGLTEVGLVAWQRSRGTGYIMSRGAIITELIPNRPTPDRYRIIVTNLELTASPIIRFDTGDLASLKFSDGRPEIVAIEGRRVDVVTCADGTCISPYRITDALRDVRGLRRFKVTQREISRFLVDLEADDEHRGAVSQAVKSTLGDLFGAGIEVDIQFHDKLLTDGARKFRPVESRVAP